MVVVKYWFLIATSLFACQITFASDEDALAELFAGFDQVQTDFDQTIADGFGRILETSSGSLSISKPSARWEVVQPYPQVILLNDKDLKIYDPDLEQVTERDLSDSWEEVPLALLLGSGAEIDEHFNVSREVSDDLTEYRLTPRADDALFESVMILVQDDQISQLSIRDQGEQETVILFRNYKPGVVLESKVFELDLPPGTDVIRG